MKAVLVIDRDKRGPFGILKLVGKKSITLFTMYRGATMTHAINAYRPLIEYGIIEVERRDKKACKEFGL